MARLVEKGGAIVGLLEFLTELTVGGQIALGILLFFVLDIIFAPWFSLKKLDDLGDIAYELRKIREELEKRTK